MDIPSLFMIPSAVSSHKVHSVFPNSTDADFDFNRDSSATRVNSQGLIETVGYFGAELITNGGFNSATGWIAQNTWVISNGVASSTSPNAGGSLYQQPTLTVSKTYRVTYTINSFVSGSIRCRVGDNFGVTRTSVGTFVEEITHTTGTRVGVQTLGDFVGSIDNISVVEVTGDRARLNYEIEGGLVNTKPSLLLEPQRTNTAEYSEDAAVYTYNDSTIRENVQIITPYGYKSQAVKIDAEFNEPYPIRAASFNLGSYSTNDVVTLSGFVKYNGYRYVQFGGYFGSESSRFDLINGVIIQNQSNVISSSMVKFPNDWYKLTVTYTFQNTIGNGYLYAGWVLSYNSSFAYTNARSGGIYVWGLQAELGSYATSYIPTNGSSQTRAAETCNGAGTSSILPSEEGILYLEVALNNQSANDISLSGAAGNNDRVTFSDSNATNRFKALIKVGGTTVFTVHATAISNTKAFNKYAIKWKENDFALWCNGTERHTDTSGSSFSSGTLNSVQFDRGDGANDFHGKIRDIRVYNTKEMTDSEVDILLTKITS
jgi:hypothetical protein